MKITDKLTAALAFSTDKHVYMDNENDYVYTYHEDVAPLHLVLVECVKALELTPCEFFGTDESGSPIHAENCVKCEALEQLAEVLK
jgi:hypothetical protein